MLLLRHERDLLPQRLERQVDEPDAADVHATAPRRVDAREQAAERRLARARRPDDRDALARLEVEVDAVQHVALGDVRVAHLFGAQPVVLGAVVRRRPVGWHGGDADEACEGRRADLDLVQPRDEPVDGIGELDDVQRDRRHLPDRGMAGRDEPAAPGERRRHGQHVRELGSREPDRAQVERPLLGAHGFLEVGVEAAHEFLAQSQCLDRSAAVDRLTDGAGHARVRGPLPQVAGRRAAQVPARADDERQHSGEARERGGRAHPDGGDDGEDRRDGRDQRLRDGEADGALHRGDVGGRARDEVAGAGALDGRQRQREHAVHEVLAQLREHLLGEHERGAAREQRQRRLREQEGGEDEHDLVDVGTRRPFLDGLDETAEQGRPGEARGSSGAVERDDECETAAVAPGEDPRLGAQLDAAGDGEELAHSSSPRVTVSR